MVMLKMTMYWFLRVIFCGKLTKIVYICLQAVRCRISFPSYNLMITITSSRHTCLVTRTTGIHPQHMAATYQDAVQGTSPREILAPRTTNQHPATPPSDSHWRIQIPLHPPITLDPAPAKPRIYRHARRTSDYLINTPYKLIAVVCWLYGGPAQFAGVRWSPASNRGRIGVIRKDRRS